MLRKPALAIVRFLQAEDGPTAVEYAVMLALIILVVFGAVQSVGSATNSSFGNSQLNTSLSGAS
jgi:pilus assembly protein Flp/PilA